MKKYFRNWFLPLFLIVFLASFLRFYQLSSLPISVYWDEAAVGYNSFTISHYGKDEWGKSFPLIFKSFEDDKHPVYIYFTSISVLILGLSEFSIRFPSALFGVLSVIMLYFLSVLLFQKKVLGLLASFILAISPYNIQFSRMNHQLNFTIFFFMLGFYLFIKGIREKNILLSLSFLSFGISFLSYHSAVVLVPIFLFFLIILYLKKLLPLKKYIVVGLLFLMPVLLAIFYSPELLGGARAQQTAFSKQTLEETKIFKLTKNDLLAKGELALNQYYLHFTPKFLFISGDINPRLSVQTIGEFYKIEAIFLILGVVFLIVSRTKISFLLLLWALLAPIPSSFTNQAPHAARVMFMTGSWHLIAGYGLYSIYNLLRNKYIQTVLLISVLIMYSYFLTNFFVDYLENYNRKYAIEWQYGMKQIVEFVKNHPEYQQVYMTSERHQPYIFFLLYLQTPIKEFLSTVAYNNGKSRSYNLVTSFDKYFFGDWNIVESRPDSEILYIVTPYEYSGFRYQPSFSIKETIRYPDGGDAFYIVSVK